MDEQTPQISPQPATEQIGNSPAPASIEDKHHNKKHKSQKHASIIIALVALIAAGFFGYRTFWLRDFTPINLVVFAITTLTAIIALSSAFRAHKKMWSGDITKKFEKDLEVEVETTQAAAKQVIAGKAPGKWGQRWIDLKDFVKECKRVWTITKKPNREEFKTIVKIAGIGILLIGLIGFLIHFAREGLRLAGI